MELATIWFEASEIEIDAEDENEIEVATILELIERRTWDQKQLGLSAKVHISSLAGCDVLLVGIGNLQVVEMTTENVIILYSLSLSLLFGPCIIQLTFNVCFVVAPVCVYVGIEDCLHSLHHQDVAALN